MALDRVGATLKGEMMETIAKLNSHFAAAHKQLSTAEKTPARGSELRICREINWHQLDLQN